jgi:hypothetical protein
MNKSKKKKSVRRKNTNTNTNKSNKSKKKTVAWSVRKFAHWIATPNGLWDTKKYNRETGVDK